MKLYGLTATGVTWLAGNVRDWNCRLLFGTKQAAAEEMPAFLDRVCQPDEYDLDCLRRETVHIEIYEYEVVTESATRDNS